MACRCSSLVAIVAILLGCGSGDGAGGEGGSGGDGGGPSSGDAYDPGDTYDPDDGFGESGSVEETAFGMSDDMPLVTDIPSIKQGYVDESTRVYIYSAVPSSGRAELGGDTWFYAQDPVAEEYMGLQITLSPGLAMPDESEWVDLVGWVRGGEEQGWQLELDSFYYGGMHPGVTPRRVRISTLTGADAVVLDDSVVDVIAPYALQVTREGPEPGTVLVGPSLGSSGALLVDLRPFGLTSQPLPPQGTLLSRLRGVVEIGGSRPAILPRTIDDFVVGP